MRASEQLPILMGSSRDVHDVGEEIGAAVAPLERPGDDGLVVRELCSAESTDVHQVRTREELEEDPPHSGSAGIWQDAAAATATTTARAASGLSLWLKPQPRPEPEPGGGSWGWGPPLVAHD
eukprot:CAMPEP_0180007068 /NCGR_PEP_ID=MMETSP0984-20121128/13676_1 /TAXON_ID=483367 /ORGANISM="non described non described, Strain CCMP 2436" /LENGTH=121 /DNA_ID=CAMNT_0021928111 /DNA_START=374 /DNA_END=736 /DNA_ORIENTATION=-